MTCYQTTSSDEPLGSLYLDVLLLWAWACVIKGCHS